MYPTITRNGKTFLVIGNLLRPLPPTAVVDCPAKAAAPTAVIKRKVRKPVPVQLATNSERQTWRILCNPRKLYMGDNGWDTKDPHGSLREQRRRERAKCLARRGMCARSKVDEAFAMHFSN